MIITVTLNPSVDKALFVDKLNQNDTNRIKRVETDIGGKGINTARVLAELKIETMATGFIGGKNGSFVRHVLKHEGVLCDFIEVTDETRINISIEEEIADSPPTTLNEPGPFIDETKWIDMIKKINSLAVEGQYLTFGGSLPPGLPIEAYRILVENVLSLGCKPIVDADGDSLKSVLHLKPFMIKPNIKEAERLFDCKITSVAESKTIAMKLYNMGIELVVLSMGADGAICVYENNIYRCVPPNIDAKSTIGSGDSMIAGILYGLENKLNIDEILRWGVAAGAATAETTGAEICQYNQVKRLVNEVKIERLS